MRIRVVKVGGSLFDWPPLPCRLFEWLDELSPAATLLVAGGGGHADLVRAADQRWQLTAEAAHRLALDAMNLNGRLLCELLRAMRPCDWLADEPSLESWLSHVGRRLGEPAHSPQSYARLATASAPNATSALAVVDLPSLLAEAEQQQARPLVERSWRITSDSLAGWLAQRFAARGQYVELVLLKSTDIEPKKTLVELHQDGVIDECLIAYAVGLSDVRLINLRAV